MGLSLLDAFQRAILESESKLPLITRPLKPLPTSLALLPPHPFSM